MAVLSSGSATGFARSALAGSPGPARLLGSFATACYLELSSGAVVAVLTSDAVQLPIGITLPWPSDLVDLRSVRARSASASAWAWASVQPDGVPEVRLDRLRIAVTGRRDAALRYCGGPVPAHLDTLSSVDGLPEAWPDEPFGPDVFDDPIGAVARLLGRGPGLTPAGDDLLCGALAAAVLFGVPRQALARAVLARLAESELATTSLSRQLLLCAVAGDGLPELQLLAEAMCRPDPQLVERAWQRLLRIGHSSGPALAAGLLAGARAGSDQEHAAGAQRSEPAGKPRHAAGRPVAA